jgi:hypothetical protein
MYGEIYYIKMVLPAKNALRVRARMEKKEENSSEGGRGKEQRRRTRKRTENVSRLSSKLRS